MYLLLCGIEGIEGGPKNVENSMQSRPCKAWLRPQGRKRCIARTDSKCGKRGWRQRGPSRWAFTSGHIRTYELVVLKRDAPHFTLVTCLLSLRFKQRNKRGLANATHLYPLSSCACDILLNMKGKDAAAALRRPCNALQAALCLIAHLELPGQS